MIEKIKKNEEFQKIYQEGKKIYGHYCLLFVTQKTSFSNNKYGFVASKKIGNAVCRNRLKRIFREIVKNHTELFPKNSDFIFVAKKTAGEKIKTLQYQEVEKDVLRILKKEAR